MPGIYLVAFPYSTWTPVFCRHEAMKSERKQTLESNLLADKIEQLAIKLKKALPVILAVTVVVVVGLLAYGFYTSVQEKESAKGWTALYFADTDMSDLTAISTDFSGTTAGLWAKQTAGDSNMSRALEKVYIDRDLAEQFYKEATSDYQTVTEKSSDPFLSGRANFGLAQASEGMGDLEKALSFYRKVIQNKAMGIELIAESTKRVEWLESKAGEAFYAWYKTSRASNPVLNVTPSNTTLPGAPDFSFPANPVGNAPIGSPPPAIAPEMRALAPTTPLIILPPEAPKSSPPNVPDGTTLPATTTPEVPKVELPKVDAAPADTKPAS